MHKTFAREYFIGAERGTTGYFIGYCKQCNEKQYLTLQELILFIEMTNFRLPLRQILWQRFLNRFHIPRFHFEIEWKKLHELKQVPVSRKNEIQSLREAGWTLEKIAKRYDLTRQRIWAILNN